LILEVNEFTAQGVAALLAMWTSSIRTASALSMAILGDKLAAKLLVALNAFEASGVPGLSQSSKNSVLNGSVASGTLFPIHTFVVVWFSLKDQILSSDTAMALSARHEFSRTVRAIYLRVVIVICTNQLLVAFSASEVLLMISPATSSYVLSTIERIVTFGTMAISTAAMMRSRLGMND